MRRLSLLAMLLLGTLPSAGCAGAKSEGCPGSVTASLTGVIAAGAAGKRGVPLPPESRAVITMSGTFGWKAQKTGTVIDGKKASGELPPPVTTTTVIATTTTIGVSFGPTTVPATIPAPRPAADLGGRSFTASTGFGNQTLTVKGTIIGPPAPCHGIGSWSVTTQDKSQSGGGSWSF